MFQLFLIFFKIFLLKQFFLAYGGINMNMVRIGEVVADFKAEAYHGGE